jgi:AraC-like DNA-binding protein
MAMDALSEALNTVRMTSAVFFNVQCTVPWGFAVPPLRDFARDLAPATESLVGFCLVTEGKACFGFEDAGDVPVEAGDLVIKPHGDAHTVSNGSPPTLIESDQVLGRILAGDLSTVRLGGGGETTEFVCGYFGCERHAARLFLAGLPSVIKINVRADAAGQWLESSIRHLLGEALSGRPGRTALLSKMADALFVEALRRYMEQLPPEANGWLAGARDAVVGAALSVMHRQPSHPWTVAELAAKSGASRSLLAERFVQFLGEPPLTYLARWRLQLAARLLETTHKTILHVAMDVGYESEAAFNRAFKREFGLPPAQYRRQFAANGTVVSAKLNCEGSRPTKRGTWGPVVEVGQVPGEARD